LSTEAAIRPFAPVDADACAEIFDRAWNAGHPYAPRRIDSAAFEAETKDENLWVAERHGKVVGFVALYEPAGFVHHLYVEPSLHGRGIGSVLLARAVREAGGRARLKCQARNTASMAFYRHLGWTSGEEGETTIGRWVMMHSPDPA
jgi:GNAT superfamily N-acetyltransferase